MKLDALRSLSVALRRPLNTLGVLAICASVLMVAASDNSIWREEAAKFRGSLLFAILVGLAWLFALGVAFGIEGSNNSGSLRYFDLLFWAFPAIAPMWIN